MVPGLQLGAAVVAAFVLPGNLAALVAGSVLAVVSPVPAAGFAILVAAELAWLFGAVFSARTGGDPAPSGPRPVAGDLLGRLEDEARGRVDRAVALAGRLVDAGADPAAVERGLWALLRLEVALQGLQTFLATTEPAQVRRLRADLRDRQVRRGGPAGPADRALADALRVCDERLAWFARGEETADRLAARLRDLAAALDGLGEAPDPRAGADAAPLREAAAAAEAALAGLPFAVGPVRAPGGLLAALAGADRLG